ncbi:MAG: hypothetical protein CSA79_04165 [Thiothrix nivea]|nr:MAG: hypothetical protein CSA79_04165 [Thiothrix nivea]
MVFALFKPRLTLQRQACKPKHIKLTPEMVSVHAQVKAIQDKLNSRPRKTLRYKTPNEVYETMKLSA